VPLLNDVAPRAIKLLTKDYQGDAVTLGVFCSHAMIPRGTKFGPFTGKIVFPGDVTRGQDNPHMWEVTSYFDT
jgi:hypothetical protein